ncbi:hypothetical protein LTR16_000753 [Cryomyces antarcticus]|uniref:Uncharacterized protein n=1 Tax=Cryomyces antarcticus TaxID=329879 RepID=A0ABR0M916_9PEZI|nr:hypothetical protein LTR16_000753 [Cryomyces antarcticus]
MMVPRSFRYSSPSEYDDKMRRSSTRMVRTAKPEMENTHKAMPSFNTSAEPISVPSKPVIIPSRSTSGIPATTQTLKSRGQHGARRIRPHGDGHKSDTIPPAVAALLAMTAIPPPKSQQPHRRRSTVTNTSRRISIDDLVQEWRREIVSASSLSNGSPMSILLEQLDEVESDDNSISGGIEKGRDLLASRSVSSDSAPSLDADDRSVTSWSSPSTPESLITGKSGAAIVRREKLLASPEILDCAFDHPLKSPHTDEEDPFFENFISKSSARTEVASSRFTSSFKSNLTASFQALKSAAKSFSNFTAPSIPPDDFLTRSLVSQRYPSEMRPKAIEGVPTAALRRYLNPIPFTPFEELQPQYREALQTDIKDESTAMIKMQTYTRRSRTDKQPRRSIQQSGTDPLSEAGRATAHTVRQREPRENSNFLRVIVLEMNMRREGKLDPKAGGRARIWLPPRDTVTKTESSEHGSERRIPRRWIGVSLAG